MKKNNKNIFWNRMLSSLLLGLMVTVARAGIPLWTFEPLTATTVAVPANATASVQYRITNQSSKPHTLVMRLIPNITQITTGLGVCGSPFTLLSKGSSCILSLQVNGGQLTTPILDGPIVCQQGNVNQCYRPGATNVLRLTQALPTTNAIITVTGSPLALTVNGSTGQLTIHNTSTQVAATNIASNFAGTALDGNVTETGNTCANVPPGGSCILTYMPGNTVVPQTNFTIQGTNTNVLTAAMAIQSGSTLTSINITSGSASGGTSVTLTGAGLSGATAVTFGGAPATSVTVVNSTTVTAVTPPHAPGPVDIVISTPAGGATLVNGYTYVPTQVGQPSSGGTIACLNGGFQDLIAATADNSTSIQWGGAGLLTGAASNVDGATNTSLIVTVVGNNGGFPYAAQLCNNYAVDSQGNTPCQIGNTCYNDWFLPALDQLNCLFINRAAIGGFTNAAYYTSTEFPANPQNQVWIQVFLGGFQNNAGKTNFQFVRCVRAFTP